MRVEDSSTTYRGGWPRKVPPSKMVGERGRAQKRIADELVGNAMRDTATFLSERVQDGQSITETEVVVALRDAMIVNKTPRYRISLESILSMRRKAPGQLSTEEVEALARPGRNPGDKETDLIVTDAAGDVTLVVEAKHVVKLDTGMKSVYADARALLRLKERRTGVVVALISPNALKTFQGKRSQYNHSPEPNAVHAIAASGDDKAFKLTGLGGADIVAESGGEGVAKLVAYRVDPQ